MSGSSPTFVDFTPNSQTAFSFSATFDGQLYNLVVLWNTFGQRWYVQCSDQNSNLVFYLPLIGSGVTCFPLASLSWTIENGGVATAVTQAPHGFSVGSQAWLSIAGCSPTGYNGSYLCDIVTTTSLIYSLSLYPGPASALGAIFDSVNMLAGYFTTSRLVYRSPLQSFEVV